MPMPKPISNLRWYIAGLLCLATTLNYLDRQALSVLANTIQHDLGLTVVQYSWITSSFLLSYTVMYLVSGRIVDRLGSRRGLTIAVSGWSVANMLHGLAKGVLQLSAFRFLLGVFESANWPACVKAVAEWFPMRERALGMGMFNCGAALGGAIAAPLVSVVALHFGWRQAFVVTGALGFFWVLLWAVLYESPAAHRRLSDAERALILEGENQEAESGGSVPLRTLMRMRETWGCVAVRMFTDPVTYFLFFWIPKYLQDRHGFSLAALGFYAWIPYLALTVGTIFGGALPYKLVTRGWTVNRARKATMLVDSACLLVLYLALLRLSSPVLAVACIAALMFGHGAWSNITIPAEVFPKRVLGTISGLGGTVGGVVSIIMQLGTGWVVQRFSYEPLFPVYGVLYLLAYGSVHWLVGELGVIRPIPRVRSATRTR
jgi:ACS family hexuronate transporter-like MFS transporter